MLQNLSEQIRLCYERAAKAKRRAEETSDSKAKAEFLNTERRWLLLARSYQHSESLNDFVRAIPDRPKATNTLVHVAERPRGEQPSRSSEEDLQTVISNTPFMLTGCSSDLKYQFVSRALAQMFGREPKDFVGKPIVDIIEEEGFNTILPHIQQVLQGKRVEYESEIHYQGIGPRVVRAIYTPDCDQKGNIQGWIVPAGPKTNVLDPPSIPPPNSLSNSPIPLGKTKDLVRVRCSAATSRGKTSTPPVFMVKSWWPPRNG